MINSTCAIYLKNIFIVSPYTCIPCPQPRLPHTAHNSSCKVVLTSPLAQGKAPEYLEVQDAPPSLTGEPSARPNISSQFLAKYLRVFHVCPWSWERSSTIAAGRGERNTRIRWVKRNSVSRSSCSVSSFTPSADCHQVSGKRKEESLMAEGGCAWLGTAELHLAHLAAAQVSLMRGEEVCL